MNSNGQSTICNHLCVWILAISVVLTLISTTCNAQTLQDKRPLGGSQPYETSELYPRDLAWALYRNSDRLKRGHRHMTDAGYGSRVQAASKIASALIAHHDLFGSYGPGKKKRTSSLGNDVIQRLLHYNVNDSS